MGWYKTVACEEIDQHANGLFDFSKTIWMSAHKKDVKNVDIITKFLKKNQFHVAYDLKGMPNTFEAWYGAGPTPGNKRLNVAFLCRYNVIGKPSQFKGNHLVAEAAVAAALGVKAVLQLSCPTVGRVSVIGCPDTLQGGVATLVNLKVFKTVDVVMTVVPGNRTDWYPQIMARKSYRATYRRTTADKPQENTYQFKPCDAINKTKNPETALPCDMQDVCMIAYQNVMAMQEHFGKNWRLKASFGRTGRLNECCTTVCTATPTNHELFCMEKRVLPCLDAAGHATGCEFETHIAQKTFYSFVNNVQMCYMLQLNAYICGTMATPLVKPKPIMEPIDVGNVSHVVPTLMPVFYTGSDADPDSEEFAKSLRSLEAHHYTIAIAKAIAMTAVDLFNNPTIITKVRKDLADSLEDEKNRSTFREFPCPYEGKGLLKPDVPFGFNVGWSKQI